MKITAQYWPLSSQNYRKVEKRSPTPLILWQPGRPAELTKWVLSQQEAFWFFLFLFVFPSETIRPGAVKGQESDPKIDQKANANN